MSKMDKIIKEANADAYDEEEQIMGWENILSENIKTPQECFAGKMQCTLIDIVGGERCLSAKMRSGKLTFTTHLENVRLEDKKQQVYIEAYKKWLPWA